jgi:hypothetical protein
MSYTFAMKLWNSISSMADKATKKMQNAECRIFSYSAFWIRLPPGPVGGQAPFSAPEDSSMMPKKVPDPFPALATS